MDTLKSFFEPKSVVVFGASRNPEKLGYGVARNLIGSGYPGKIYLVNPKGGELFGKKLLNSVNEIKDPVDLGLIVVPSRHVPELLIEASENGIDNFIILTGGFKESGLEGARIEARCKQIAEELNLRIMGPNCIGILDTHYPLDTTFIQPPMPGPGEIAFITHSGALGAALIDWARAEGFGFSQLVSLGNQLDITESDVLLPVANSQYTDAVTMYIESVQDGVRFIGRAERASEIKPVLALKAGLSEAGKNAAASHTGALAGSDSAYSAAFRRAGILRVENVQELFAKAKALAWSPESAGDRVAILTNAGGPGVLAADAAERHGLTAADFSEDTIHSLADLLPPEASIENPVDMLASASPETYAQCLQVLLDDPGVDMVLVIAPPPPMFEALHIAQQVAGVVKQSSKPVVVSFMGSKLVKEAVTCLRSAKVPEFPFPEDGMSALAALWQRHQIRNRDTSILSYQISKEKKNRITQILKGGGKNQRFLLAMASLEIAKLYDLPVLDLYFASSPGEAAEAAVELGFPVALKIGVDGISHKSDHGGVLLNLKSREEVLQGFEKLSRRVEALIPADKQFGVHIQKMVKGGQEVIIGAVRDPVFGPMVMFGSGGVDVEGLKDIQFSVAPMIKADLEFMLENTWAGKKLKGYRNYPPADIQKVRDALIKVGQILVDNPIIKEIEINPLIVLRDDQGAVAVDIRIVV